MFSAVEPATPPRGTWGVTWRAGSALLIGVVAWLPSLGQVLDSGTRFQQVWFWAVDPVVGIAAVAVALLFSRRYPVPIGVGTAALTLLSGLAFGAAVLALCSVATRRRWVEIAVVAGAGLATYHLGTLIYPSSGESNPWWVPIAFEVVGVGLVIAVGVAVGQRRALVDGLRERAETAEREQAARVDATRIAERNRIARDMHDVLAHRISLVAMHAAAVGYRPDLTADERQAALRTIEENARLALAELRDVLGVLRDPAVVTGAPEPPQPRLADIATLVDEGRAAGMHIDLVEDLATAIDADTATSTPSDIATATAADPVTAADPASAAGTAGEPPSLTAQTAYRVVREALTNARKHAPDTRVTVSVAGEPGDGLALRVTNPAPLRPGGTGLPGAGLGLVGLTERVATAGGRITHGPRADGGYELAVWLPWVT